ncbi:MAG: 3-methyl-2-oxobutanoate dehydrogenase subunit VorB [Planctomycetes bacterium]|jgi:2-oxoglutarate ferredoxin oxidoreductase subunit alpha|nr:3-methyl-2-oxobutanoate dehydrogenase subunit VorB [Planctomycetota bacterium]
MAKVLMKGNEAIGEAAIRAGCRNFFGYPITPQSEVPEYLSRRFPEVGGTYVQAESEVAAINMLYGGAGVGKRVLTTSSSPGISLMSEGISYIAACELPVVLVNIVRGGPGLGGILPAQSDYHQATRGIGHGDFRLLVLAPASVQEAVNLIYEAFDLADRYRNPVLILGDGMIGQMMEPVEFPPMRPLDSLPEKPWAATGMKDRPQNVINSLYLNEHELNAHNFKLKAKYDQVAREQVRFETWRCDGDLDVLVVAFGTMARIVKTALADFNAAGGRGGVFRPITLWPYPHEQLRETARRAKKVLVIEMNTGQMIDDVRMALGPDREVGFFGRTGGVVPTPDDVLAAIGEVTGKGAAR